MPTRRRRQVPNGARFYDGRVSRVQTDCAVCDDPIPVGVRIAPYRGRWAHVACVYRMHE